MLFNSPSLLSPQINPHNTQKKEYAYFVAVTHTQRSAVMQ